MKAPKNIFVVIGVAVVALLLVGAGTLLGLGAWRLANSKASLKGLKARWRVFYEQSNPFPSRENIEKERKNNDTIDAWFADFMKDLRKDQIVPGKGKSAAAFGDDLRVERDKMIAKGKAKGLSIPDDFAFGFGRYTGKGSVLPVVEHVPYLWQQLEIIERLYDLLLECDIKSLVSIEREEFDTGAAPAGVGVSEGVPSWRPGTIPPDALYGKLHFTVVFTAREAAVWEVLNLLSKQGLIIVATSVALESQGLDVIKAALPVAVEKGDTKADQPSAATARPPRGSLSGRRAAERAAAAEKEKPKEPVDESRIPTRQERIVCGPSKAAPVKVKIELDVYRFRED